MLALQDSRSLQKVLGSSGRGAEAPLVLKILLKGIKSNPELASYFHDFTDFELKCFYSLLKYEATDPVNRVQAVIGKALSGKCTKSMSFTSCCAFIDILTQQFSSILKPKEMLMRFQQRRMIG